MNGYEYLRSAVLVLLLLFPLSCIEARSVVALSGALSQDDEVELMCSMPSEDSSHWVQNQCFDGYLTVQGRRVVAQHHGVNKHSKKVEFLKESCKDSNAGIFGPVMVRLFHKETQTYVCFNRRGKIRALSKRRAERFGKLCAFFETAYDDPYYHSNQTRYIHYISASSHGWWLSFNRNPRKLVYSKDGHAVSLPRSAVNRRGQRKPVKADKCDYKFATGQVKKDLMDEWTGLKEFLMESNKFVDINSLLRGEDKETKDLDVHPTISAADKKAVPETAHLDRVNSHSDVENSFVVDQRLEVHEQEDYDEDFDDEEESESMNELIATKEFNRFYGVDILENGIGSYKDDAKKVPHMMKSKVYPSASDLYKSRLSSNYLGSPGLQHHRLRHHHGVHEHHRRRTRWLMKKKKKSQNAQRKK